MVKRLLAGAILLGLLAWVANPAMAEDGTGRGKGKKEGKKVAAAKGDAGKASPKAHTHKRPDMGKKPTAKKGTACEAGKCPLAQKAKAARKGGHGKSAKAWGGESKGRHGHRAHHGKGLGVQKKQGHHGKGQLGRHKGGKGHHGMKAGSRYGQKCGKGGKAQFQRGPRGPWGQHGPAMGGHKKPGKGPQGRMQAGPRGPWGQPGAMMGRSPWGQSWGQRGLAMGVHKKPGMKEKAGKGVCPFGAKGKPGMKGKKAKPGPKNEKAKAAPVAKKPESGRRGMHRPAGPMGTKPGAAAGKGPQAGPPQRAMPNLFERADKNKDGKLTKDELPAPIWEHLEKAGAVKDGAVTKDSMESLRKKMQEQFQKRGGPGGPGSPAGPGPWGPGGPGRHHGPEGAKPKSA
jgi:hypothetical protein